MRVDYVQRIQISADRDRALGRSRVVWYTCGAKGRGKLPSWPARRSSCHRLPVKPWDWPELPGSDRSRKTDLTPSFDIVRIEPGGDAVIAGRSMPGATVELLRDGVIQDKAITNGSGQFVMIPPRLPPGRHELTLVAMQPDGKQVTSKRSVSVAVAPSETR